MKPKPFSISKYFPVLLLLIFLSFFAHLGNTPLFDPDEGVYCEVTREMVASNNFTTPLLNGMPFFHKPPLFYWAQAASIKVLGLNEFGLRLPSAVAALLLTISLFLFTRRFYDTKTAWFAGLYMVSSFLVVLIARAATPDAMLNLFLTLTMLNIYRFYHTGDKRSIYWSFMFMALGVLIKGSIAIILPVTVSIIYFGIQRKWRQLALFIFNPVGLIVFGLIVIPWYLGEYMLHGEAFLSELLLLPSREFETYNLTSGYLSYFLYPAVILIGLLPFSGIFVKALFSIRKLLKDSLAKFMIIWFFLTLLLLPLVQSNSFLSLSYCFPPLFILMARITENFRHVINLFIWPLLFIASLFLILNLAPHIAGSIENEFVRKLVIDSTIYFETSYRLIVGAVILLLTALPFIKPVPQPLKYGILGLLFVGMINFFGLPLLGNILQQPIKTAGLQVKKENLTVIAWKVHYPSFNVYAERLTEIRSPDVGDIVLTRSEYLTRGTEYDTLFQQHGIILAKILKMPAATSSRKFYY